MWVETLAAVLDWESPHRHRDCLVFRYVLQLVLTLREDKRSSYSVGSSGPFQLLQRNPLGTGPWEEPTSLPENTEKRAPLDPLDPLLSSGWCFWVFYIGALDDKGFLK